MSFRNDSEAIGEEIAEQNPPTLAFYIFFTTSIFLQKMLKQVQCDAKGMWKTGSGDTQRIMKLVQCDAKGGFLELEFGFYEVVEKIYGLGNA